MTTTDRGRVTEETGSPRAATTQYAAYTSKVAIMRDLLVAVGGGTVTAAHIAQRLSRTDFGGLGSDAGARWSGNDVVDDAGVTLVNSTLYPAYTAKYVMLEDLIDATGGGAAKITQIAFKFGNTDPTALSDVGSYLN